MKKRIMLSVLLAIPMGAFAQAGTDTMQALQNSKTATMEMKDTLQDISTKAQNAYNSAQSAYMSLKNAVNQAIYGDTQPTTNEAVKNAETKNAAQ
jgi:hypothetical protein